MFLALYRNSLPDWTSEAMQKKDYLCNHSQVKTWEFCYRRWASKLIANPQILEFIPLSQIRTFLRCVSPKIASLKNSPKRPPWTACLHFPDWYPISTSLTIVSIFSVCCYSGYISLCSWRMVVYIYYIVAAGNSISSQLGIFNPYAEMILLLAPTRWEPVGRVWQNG